MATPQTAEAAGTRARYCVIVSGAARARILLLATAESGLAPTLMPLTEVVAESRELADQVAEAASRVWRTLPACDIVVVASPSMLVQLRPAIARRTGGRGPHTVRELARDLSKLAPATLHDALATAGHLPPRGRRRPLPRWQRPDGGKNAG